jgi:lipoprotein-releasing system permease protein
MFEFSVALKYLLPQKKQLSLSIISVVSVFVISLVVWLVLVFLSITNGMEKNWIEKLVALNGPIQITPKNNYYNSYYYLIDSLSLSSDYQLKSIEEKLNSPTTDPYNPKTDLEIPEYWSPAFKNSEEKTVDLVKSVYSGIEQLKRQHPQIIASNYETAYTSFNIKLVRTQKSLFSKQNFNTSSLLTQSGFVSSIDPSVPRMVKNILPPDAKDIDNFIHSSMGNNFDYFDDSIAFPPEELFKTKAGSFFSNFELLSVKTPLSGWILPHGRIQNLKSVKVLIIGTLEEVEKILLPTRLSDYKLLNKKLKEKNANYLEAYLKIEDGKPFLSSLNKEKIDLINKPIVILKDTEIPAKLDSTSLEQAKNTNSLLLNLVLNVQDQNLKFKAPIGNLELSQVNIRRKFSQPPEKELSPPWLFSYPDTEGNPLYRLPLELGLDDPVFLPKAFKDKGARIGDKGYLSYQSSTSSSVQEQKVSFYVAGFFDPGLAPLGNRMILSPRAIPNIVNNDTGQDGKNRITGIRIDIPDLSKIPALKKEIEENLDKQGLGKYWKVESFYEYEFSKDFIEQLQSDKTLLALIAVIIIIVACSNIVSMLILLVNDKKVEIGILQSMGASSKSIGIIFGSCGIALGFTGCLLGTLMAMFTLANFDYLVFILSQIQGHNAFNAAFYGDTIPAELSLDALYFVIITTIGLSLVAGIIPAIKASLIKPTDILRT